MLVSHQGTYKEATGMWVSLAGEWLPVATGGGGGGGTEIQWVQLTPTVIVRVLQGGSPAVGFPVQLTWTSPFSATPINTSERPTDSSGLATFTMFDFTAYLAPLVLPTDPMWAGTYGLLLPSLGVAQASLFTVDGFALVWTNDVVKGAEYYLLDATGAPDGAIDTNLYNNGGYWRFPEGYNSHAYCLTKNPGGSPLRLLAGWNHSGNDPNPNVIRVYAVPPDLQPDYGNAVRLGYHLCWVDAYTMSPPVSVDLSKVPLVGGYQDYRWGTETPDPLYWEDKQGVTCKPPNSWPGSDGTYNSPLNLAAIGFAYCGYADIACDAPITPVLTP